MAFRDIDNEEGLPAFYNVTAAVGKGAPNRKDDVMLVQFLLLEFYKRAPLAPPFLFPAGDLTVDGIYGRITGTWLLTFQQDMRKRSFSILADGRADRVRGIVSSISRTIYTLSALNTFVSQVRPDFDKLEQATDVPNELAFQLF